MIPENPTLSHGEIQVNLSVDNKNFVALFWYSGQPRIAGYCKSPTKKWIDRMREARDVYLEVARRLHFTAADMPSKKIRFGRGEVTG